MFRSYFCISLLLAFAWNTTAQTVHCLKGTKIENYPGESFVFSEQDHSSLFAFRGEGFNYFIDVYDKNSLTINGRIKIPLPSRDSINYTLENLIVHNDTFHIFYSYFDRILRSENVEMIE